MSVMRMVKRGNLPKIYDKNGRFALSFIKQIMLLPGVKVDRSAFLRSQLRSRCRRQQVERAIEYSPAAAGIRGRKINQIANGVIQSHVGIASAGSFAAGLSGSFAALATIPADAAQFYVHALVLAQKLAYLYGWPDLLEKGEVDDETELKVLMLLGSMLGVAQATHVLKLISKDFAQQVVKRVAKQALTKTFYYPVLKQSLKWIGISLTKQSFARGVSKVIPVLGGFASAGLTAVTLRPMARRLKRHLRKLEFAKQNPGLLKAGES